MRGVIPGVWLQEFEKRVGPVHRYFDLIGGTSTGGILALLMAAGVSAENALKFYYDSGPRIFTKNIFRKIYSVGGALHTKYRSETLHKELEACLGPRLLRDTKVPVMVTSLSNVRQAVMVKSWHDEWRELPMADAALMTSSAQTYFPQARIPKAPGRATGYLDGGNVRNNPSVCVLVEALRMFGTKEPIMLVHLGTGVALHSKPLPDGGAAFWAAQIFDCTTNGDDSYDDYQCGILDTVLPGFRYERFDVGLDKFPGLDDASRKTLDKLADQATSALGEYGHSRFTDVCEAIRQSKLNKSHV